MRVDKIQDPTYLDINWKDKTNNFMVVHRLGSKAKVWNKGIGKKMMDFAENISFRSYDPRFQVGAVVTTHDNCQVLAVGYN